MKRYSKNKQALKHHVVFQTFNLDTPTLFTLSQTHSKFVLIKSKFFPPLFIEFRIHDWAVNLEKVLRLAPSSAHQLSFQFSAVRSGTSTS